MKHNQEWTQFKRLGTEAPRAYYIPFAESQSFSFDNRILNRNDSERFISLNGTWTIKEHATIYSVDLDEKLSKKIPVPSCVQMHGYDQILHKRFGLEILS